LTEGRAQKVLGSFFQLKLVYNKGGALGTDFGSSAFYLVSSLLILAIVIYFIVVNRDKLSFALPMGAIAGGAIGNIIDRIRLGQVVDFLDFDFFNINMMGLNIDRWWIFNIADASITVGVIILLAFLLFSGKQVQLSDDKTDKTTGDVTPDSNL